MALRVLVLVLLAVGCAGAARAELRGHGGPVRAIAVAPDGATAVSGSFDHAAIVWDVERETARAVLRAHDGAVNAAAFLPDGRMVTGGADGRIVLWRPGEAEPAHVMKAHAEPIAAVAVSADGGRVGSASWDGTARITDVASGAVRVLEGHTGNVNAVASAPDGGWLTAGYDATLRRWAADGVPREMVTLPTALNAAAVAQDGEAVAAGADGIVRFVGLGGAVRAEADLATGPITALALSADHARVAAATASGAVAVIDRASAQVTLRLPPRRGPVWAVAFAFGGREILTGGQDGVVRRWDGETGMPVGVVGANVLAATDTIPVSDRGAQVFGACAACHTLTPDGGNRAGPTLHGVFGRRIGTAPGYRYSEALPKLDIVWSADTISKLFEVGPAAFTPGTKMPEQRVGDADRAALVAFLEKATRSKP